jgi:hypothetical protein
MQEETWHRPSRHTVKPVLRGHIWDKGKVALLDRWPLKTG